jgi:hypothetical protein
LPIIIIFADNFADRLFTWFGGRDQELALEIAKFVPKAAYLCK